MPPSAQDNQGLKIAVAVFVTLSVVLAVATYFGFSNSSFYYEKMDQATKDASQAKQAQGTLQHQFEELKELAGYPKVEDAKVAEQIKSDREEQNKAVAAIRGRMDQIFNQIREASDANIGPEVQKIYEAANSAAESFQNEPNRTQASAINRLISLMTNESELMAYVTADYAATRKELEASNQIAQQKVQVEVDAKEGFQADLTSEQNSHNEQRDGLLTRLDELQSRNQQLATENNTLKEQLAQVQADWSDRWSKQMAVFRQMREDLEKNEKVLDQADGYITFVDYNREEVRTTLSRRQGAHEQLIFSVFDKDAPGLPSDEPKAVIELIKVDDNGSIGRITKQLRTADPIRHGDQVYSPSFGEHPKSYALIGKIDLDRNGYDDREDLKRLIQATGGVISYDLPPPGRGEETGEITPLTSWYIIDDSQPIRAGVGENIGATAEQEQAFLKRRSEVLEEARLAGVRPISLDRLKGMLGYSFGSKLPGRVEAIDRKALEQINNPRGIVRPKPGQPAPDAEASETAPEAEPEPEPDDSNPF